MPDDPHKSDIDFDELDKAVSSLMGKIGNETIDDEAEKQKTLAINPTLRPDQEPEYGQLEKTAEKIGDETVVTTDDVALPDDIEKLPSHMELPVVAKTPAVPRPNSGRFMDMVHPKGDMRTNVAPPTPDLVVPSRPSAIVARPIGTSAQKAADTSHVPSSEKPAESPLVDGPLSTTPFLPDAKVEKRPLGGTGATIAPLTPENELLSAAEEATATVDPVSEESIGETATINNDTGAVETGGGDFQRQLDPGDFEVSSTDQALAQIELAEAKQESAPQTIETVESGDTEHLKTGSKMSYQEAQERMEPTAGAIYDVNNYHQPLAHPKGQKSGWGIVVIIVVIIVIAATLGAAAYFILGLGV